MAVARSLGGLLHRESMLRINSNVSTVQKNNPKAKALRLFWCTMRSSPETAIAISARRGGKCFHRSHFAVNGDLPFELSTKKQPQGKSLRVILVHHEEFESPTFGSVGTSKSCFLSPRVRTILIIVYRYQYPKNRRLERFFTSKLLIFAIKSIIRQ